MSKSLQNLEGALEIIQAKDQTWENHMYAQMLLIGSCLF